MAPKTWIRNQEPPSGRAPPLFRNWMIGRGEAFQANTPSATRRDVPSCFRALSVHVYWHYISSCQEDPHPPPPQPPHIISVYSYDMVRRHHSRYVDECQLTSQETVKIFTSVNLSVQLSDWYRLTPPEVYAHLHKVTYTWAWSLNLAKNANSLL